jgi:hypothetical protein
MYIYTHTHTYTYMHTYMLQTYMHTDIQTYIYMYICTHIHVHIHIHYIYIYIICICASLSVLASSSQVLIAFVAGVRCLVLHCETAFINFPIIYFHQQNSLFQLNLQYNRACIANSIENGSFVDANTRRVGVDWDKSRRLAQVRHVSG